LAEKFGRFTLSRVKDAQGWSYKAEGSVNFFGDSLIRVGGAGYGIGSNVCPLNSVGWSGRPEIVRTRGWLRVLSGALI
jgi:hypothetical protein